VSGSDRWISSIVRSKYPKIRRTSSSIKRRVADRKASTAGLVVSRSASAARRYAALTVSGTTASEAGLSPDSSDSGSASQAEAVVGEATIR
jgi:hypothetical protein